MVGVAWSRCRQLAAVLGAAFPAGLALELFLKAVVDRPRPVLAAGFGSSFPSGHVLAAAAFWGLVPPWVYLVTRRRWAWAASAGFAGLVLVMVGLSRVHVGAHWPSDVVAGYLGGAVFLLAAEWAVRRPSRALACEACDLHPLRR
jgi:undecaprenyl-diphosphatase